MGLNGREIGSIIVDEVSTTYQDMQKAAKIAKQEQAMKTILEKLEAENLGKQFKASPPPTLKERLEEKSKTLTNQLERLSQAKEELNGLALKEGDAAFHPVYGNVLIKDYFIGDCTTMNTSKDFDGKICARILSVQGQWEVLATTLLPISEATKVLYGKKA